MIDLLIAAAAGFMFGLPCGAIVMALAVSMKHR